MIHTIMQVVDSESQNSEVCPGCVGVALIETFATWNSEIDRRVREMSITAKLGSRHGDS
jgi:hypothetical protein